MKKTALVAATICLSLTALQAQKKYEKIAYQETSMEGEGISVAIKDPVSLKEQTKFKVKINNKSDNFVLFRASESSIKVNGADYKPTEKPMWIAPGESESKVVNIKGTEFMVTAYSYHMDGLYKLSQIQDHKAEDFQLPPSQNEFKTGNFTCTMTDLKKETDKTAVKFECRYTGDKIGIIYPGRSAVRLPDGTEIANAKSDARPVLLEKGESDKFTLVWNRMEGGKATDMQKIKMMIVWRNTFQEGSLVKEKALSTELKIDEAQSK